MPEPELSPRAARRLRHFGRRRAPDDDRGPGFGEPDGSDPGSGPEDVAPAVPGDARPAPSTMAPGSIWGPQLSTTRPVPDQPAAPPPTGPSAGPPPPAPEQPHPHPAPSEASPRPTDAKHRRRAGERPADPESVDIHAEDSHAWWARRDDLDRVVNPKKRGAAARAQRAARQAFAPAGTANVATGTYAEGPSHSYSWDPSAVYSWGTGPDPAAAAQPEAALAEQTPWDVLGLTSEATWPEVARRHRLLAKQHHPDRHAHSGGEARVRAEQRMAEINAAFGDLRRIYRLTDGI